MSTPAQAEARGEPTPRELQVFATVCRLGSQQAAADYLGIRVHTVRNHCSRLYTAIGAEGMAHAAWLLWGPGNGSGTEQQYEIVTPGVLTEA